MLSLVQPENISSELRCLVMSGFCGESGGMREMGELTLDLPSDPSAELKSL